MMKLKFILVILSISFSCSGQTNDSLKFSYWIPKSWFSGDKKLLRDNINKYKFSQEQMDHLVNEIGIRAVHVSSTEAKTCTYLNGVLIL